jgi:hypothetical protein
MMSGGEGRGSGQKVLSKPSSDSFAVGRRQKIEEKIPQLACVDTRVVQVVRVVGVCGKGVR